MTAKTINAKHVNRALFNRKFCVNICCSLLVSVMSLVVGKSVVWHDTNLLPNKNNLFIPAPLLSLSGSFLKLSCTEKIFSSEVLMNGDNFYLKMKISNEPISNISQPHTQPDQSGHNREIHTLKLLGGDDREGGNTTTKI